MSPPRTRIAIIGAGPVGLWVAITLIDSGHDVTVFDSGRPGAGWAAGGMLSPRYEAAQELRVPLQAVEEGNHWLMQYGQMAMERWTHAGAVFALPLAPVHWVGPNGLERIEPDRVVDPRAWLAALRGAVAATAVMVRDVDVSAIEDHALRLADGSLTRAFDLVVVATGYSRAALVAELAALVPVTGQLVEVAGTHADGAIRKDGLYVIGRERTTVIGATSRRGDASGAASDPDASDLLEKGSAIVPGLAGAVIHDTWAGVRPGTADGLPMVGWSSVPSVLIANGTYRNGWLLAPVIGQMVENALRGRPMPAEFDPKRFKCD